MQLLVRYIGVCALTYVQRTGVLIIGEKPITGMPASRTNRASVDAGNMLYSVFSFLKVLLGMLKIQSKQYSLFSIESRKTLTNLLSNSVIGFSPLGPHPL